MPPRRTAKLSVEAPAAPDAIDKLANELSDQALLDELRGRIEAALDESTSLEELLARLDGMATGPAGQKLVDMMAAAMFNARLAGELGAPIRDLG